MCKFLNAKNYGLQHQINRNNIDYKFKSIWKEQRKNALCFCQGSESCGVYYELLKPGENVNILIDSDII